METNGARTDGHAGGRTASDDTVPDGSTDDHAATVGALLPRRRVLAAGGAAGLGMTALVLPGAAAASSESLPGGTGTEGSSDALDSGANSTINAVLVRTNSPEQIIIGGFFSAYGGTTLGGEDGLKTRLLALTPTGEINTTVSATFPQLSVVPFGLYAHTRTIDGTEDRGLLILHGTLVNGTAPTGPDATAEEEYSGRFLIRLKNDGSLDEAFNANVPLMGRTHKGEDPPTLLSWQVGDIASSVRPKQVAVRTDGANAGKILLAGGFNEVADPADNRGTLKLSTRLKRFGLLQLNADGTLDTGFAPDWGNNGADVFSSQTVMFPEGIDVAVDADSNIIFAAGSIFGIRDVTGTTFADRRYLVLASGSTGVRIATTFNDTAPNQYDTQTPLKADAVALTDDGSLLVIARETDGFTGSADDGLNNSSWVSVRCYSRTPDGAAKYTLQSSLTTFVPRHDGKATPNPAVGSTPGQQPRLFRTGPNTFILSTPLVDDTPSSGHRRITYTGGATPSLTAVKLGVGTSTLTNSFGTFAAPILGSAKLASGRLVAVGGFTTINTVERNRITFLEPDGTVTGSTPA
jgi:hypothetical protein